MGFVVEKIQCHAPHLPLGAVALTPIIRAPKAAGICWCLWHDFTSFLAASFIVADTTQRLGKVGAKEDREEKCVGSEIKASDI